MCAGPRETNENFEAPVVVIQLLDVVSLQPHRLQHARLPCPSPSPRACSNSCPLNCWCHPTISSSVIPFSSCPQSLPASGSFPMSQLFAWGGQSIGVCSNSCPLNWWCHPTISSSTIPFSSCPQSFPASGFFPVSWLFASGSWSIQLQYQSFQWIFRTDFL